MWFSKNEKVCIFSFIFLSPWRGKREKMKRKLSTEERVSKKPRLEQTFFSYLPQEIMDFHIFPLLKPVWQFSLRIALGEKLGKKSELAVKAAGDIFSIVKRGYEFTQKMKEYIHMDRIQILRAALYHGNKPLVDEYEQKHPYDKDDVRIACFGGNKKSLTYSFERLKINHLMDRDFFTNDLIQICIATDNMDLFRYICEKYARYEPEEYTNFNNQSTTLIWASENFLKLFLVESTLSNLRIALTEPPNLTEKIFKKLPKRLEKLLGEKEVFARKVKLVTSFLVQNPNLRDYNNIDSPYKIRVMLGADYHYSLSGLIKACTDIIKSYSSNLNTQMIEDLFDSLGSINPELNKLAILYYITLCTSKNKVAKLVKEGVPLPQIVNSRLTIKVLDEDVVFDCSPCVPLLGKETLGRIMVTDPTYFYFLKEIGFSLKDICDVLALPRTFSGAYATIYNKLRDIFIDLKVIEYKPLFFNDRSIIGTLHFINQKGAKLSYSTHLLQIQNGMVFEPDISKVDPVHRDYVVVSNIIFSIRSKQSHQYENYTLHIYQNGIKKVIICVKKDKEFDIRKEIIFTEKDFGSERYKQVENIFKHLDIRRITTIEKFLIHNVYGNNYLTNIPGTALAGVAIRLICYY